MTQRMKQHSSCSGRRAVSSSKADKAAHALFDREAFRTVPFSSMEGGVATAMISVPATSRPDNFTFQSVRLRWLIVILLYGQ